LIALVGSIVLTLQTRHDVKKQSVAHQRSRSPDKSVFLVDLDPVVTSQEKKLGLSTLFFIFYKCFIVVLKIFLLRMVKTLTKFCMICIKV
jgi:hypothetical protein